MLKTGKSGKLMVGIFLIILLSSGYADASDAVETNNSVSYNADSSFDEFTTDPHFIAVRGTLPETIDQEWENLVTECVLSLEPSYTIDRSIRDIYHAEAIEIHLGSAYKGKINESKIDEIYQKIEHHCEQEAGISEIPVVFMWAEDEEDLPLPDYGPEILENAKSDPSVIAVYGTMPVIVEEEEKREWLDTIQECISSSGSELHPYMKEFGGPLVGFGTNYRGYLSVEFNEDLKNEINDSTIDEIYTIINTHAKEAGISDIPVVFRLGGTVVEDIATYEPPATEGNNSTRSTPGFTSIMLLLCLLLLMKMQRK
jgi:hypothetical protein